MAPGAQTEGMELVTSYACARGPIHESYLDLFVLCARIDRWSEDQAGIDAKTCERAVQPGTSSQMQGDDICGEGR